MPGRKEPPGTGCAMPRQWQRRCRYMGNFGGPHEHPSGSHVALSIYRARSAWAELPAVWESNCRGSPLRDLASYMGKLFVRYWPDIFTPDDAYGMSTQRNGNEPFAQQFFERGAFMQLRYLKVINRLIATLGKQRVEKSRSHCLFRPLPPRVFRD